VPDDPAHRAAMRIQTLARTRASVHTVSMLKQVSDRPAAAIPLSSRFPTAARPPLSSRTTMAAHGPPLPCDHRRPSVVCAC
jgi:hypothetical protein